MKMIGCDHWNAKLYDGSHAFVSKFGSDLIELLAPQKGESILDIGCGTGDLANELHRYGVKVIGIDQSTNMVNEACKKYPHIKFIVEDVLKMPFTNEFDAVFSNATLHWVKEPFQALSRIYNSLKRGGRFVAEFGGKGNVHTITNEIIYHLGIFDIEYSDSQFPWYFPSIGEYTTLMEKVGFRVTFAEHFDRPTILEGEDGIRNWIEMFAKSMFDDQIEEKIEQIITKIEDRLRDKLYIENRWITDYKRIRIIGIKE